MKDRKLISMVDYVFKIVQTPNINEAICLEQTEERLSKIYNYANFLNTPLELGMFVPCENGNVLEKPNFNLTSVTNEVKKSEWSRSEQNVLFEGFFMVRQLAGIVLLSNNEVSIRYSLKEKKFSIARERIEDLTTLNLTLTDQAVKKYGI